MPSNIFANTGTNVSVLFIDKTNSSGEVMLIDASNLGEKIKEGKNQKTILNKEEIAQIENAFINEELVEEFSVKVNYEKIKQKDYSFSAGQYFDIKIRFKEITHEEFENKMDNYKNNIISLFDESKELDKSIESIFERVYYGN